MKKDMDKIVFESRHEIEKTILALEIFLQEHPNHHSYDAVFELKNKLEIMHMDW